MSWTRTHLPCQHVRLLNRERLWKKWMDDDNKTRYYILNAISDDLQRQHENILTTRQMLAHLQELFGEQSRVVKYQVCQRLFKVKMRDG